MTTTLIPTTRWNEALSEWTRALGCLGAAALVTRPPDWAPVRPEMLEAARAVLVAAGLDPAEAPSGRQLACPLAQVAAIVGPGEFAWLEQPDAVLLAQGRASGNGVQFAARDQVVAGEVHARVHQHDHCGVPGLVTGRGAERALRGIPRRS